MSLPIVAAPTLKGPSSVVQRGIGGATTIGLFRLINRYLAEPTQQGGQRPAQQASTLRAGISENRNTARNQARPHCRDAAVVRGRDDRCDHGRDGLAATFGAAFCRGGPQEALT
jgi:hypothetical protein